MAHIHSVYDTDHHFKIDPLTRAITTESKKVTLTQGDHNSERFTFELPRFIEGHDMKTCNRVQVHYINIDQLTRAQSADLYEADDFDVSPEDEDVVIFSWLIHGNATKYAGLLNFAVRFMCVNDIKVEYSWNTAIYTAVNISNGINNTEQVAEDFSDILQIWWDRLYTSASLPISVLSTDEFKTLEEKGLVESNTLYLFTDDGNWGFVQKSGDTMTGMLQLPYLKVRHPSNQHPTIGFQGSESEATAGALILHKADDARIFHFSIYHKDQDGNADRFSENFRLPEPSAGATRMIWYDILTSKNPVTIGQGGTGATDAAGARANLGVPSLEGLDTGKIPVQTARQADVAGTADKALNAYKVNNLEIKQDAKGVLKIGDIIIPQKKVIYSGKFQLSPDGDKRTRKVTLPSSVAEGDILEICTNKGSFKFEITDSMVNWPYSYAHGADLWSYLFITWLPDTSTLHIENMGDLDYIDIHKIYKVIE